MIEAVRHVFLVIHGRVQGVGYRAWLRHQAELHGLAGTVRNRRDGTVEAVLSGAGGAVDIVVAACRMGPRGAEVTDVAVTSCEPAGEAGFRLLPTL